MARGSAAHAWPWPPLDCGGVSAVAAQRLIWTASADAQALGAAGYDVIGFAELKRDVVDQARAATARRTALGNPAQAWLDRVRRAGAIAVLGVSLGDLDDLSILLGYVLEPALRAGTAVAIESRDRLTQLDPARFVDPEFEYPYTLERALRAALRLFRGARPSDAGSHSDALLDAEQRRAVDAGDGVVQVVAPAGSGKTAVLVGRVRELLRRGVRPERLLCTTFNRDARLELHERLEAAGVSAVQARTFHSVGMWLMREEGLLRPGGVRGQLSLGQWRRLATIAAREEGHWIDPADARAAISFIKLGRLATPAEFRRDVGRDEDDRRSPGCTSSTNVTCLRSASMTSTISCSSRSVRCARMAGCGSGGRSALSRCSSMSTRTSSPPRNCSCGFWPRRTTASSASATRTRRCTGGVEPACAGSLSSTSPTPVSSGSRWPTTIGARARWWRSRGGSSSTTGSASRRQSTRPAMPSTSARRRRSCCASTTTTRRRPREWPNG